MTDKVHKIGIFMTTLKIEVITTCNPHPVSKVMITINELSLQINANVKRHAEGGE